jgi:hypothetical protein
LTKHDRQIIDKSLISLPTDLTHNRWGLGERVWRGLVLYIFVSRARPGLVPPYWPWLYAVLNRSGSRAFASSAISRPADLPGDTADCAPAAIAFDAPLAMSRVRIHDAPWILTPMEFPKPLNKTFKVMIKRLWLNGFGILLRGCWTTFSFFLLKS